jgi:hypothetical protein
MKLIELKRFKKALGSAFSIFFSSDAKKLAQKQGIGKQLDLVLVTPGTQTATVTHLRKLTGWTVKQATAFFKEGEYPKVVIYNVNPKGRLNPDESKEKKVVEEKAIEKYMDIEFYILNVATKDNVIFKIY